MKKFTEKEETETVHTKCFIPGCGGEVRKLIHPSTGVKCGKCKRNWLTFLAMQNEAEKLGVVFEK